MKTLIITAIALLVGYLMGRLTLGAAPLLGFMIIPGALILKGKGFRETKKNREEESKQPEQTVKWDNPPYPRIRYPK